MWTPKCRKYDLAVCTRFSSLEIARAARHLRLTVTTLTTYLVFLRGSGTLVGLQDFCCVGLCKLWTSSPRDRLEHFSWTLENLLTGPDESDGGGERSSSVEYRCHLATSWKSSGPSNLFPRLGNLVDLQFLHWRRMQWKCSLCILETLRGISQNLLFYFYTCYLRCSSTISQKSV